MLGETPTQYAFASFQWHDPAYPGLRCPYCNAIRQVDSYLLYTCGMSWINGPNHAIGMVLRPPHEAPHHTPMPRQTRHRERA